MARRDPQRTQKLRIAVRYLLERECMAKGNQTRLAEHFKVSRQRVHQIVVEERQRLPHASVSLGPPALSH
jgi:plasmid maintenance system antidote protein VapI